MKNILRKSKIFIQESDVQGIIEKPLNAFSLNALLLVLNRIESLFLSLFI